MIKHYTEYNRPKFDELLKVKERLPDIVKAAGASKIGELLMAEITKFVQAYTVVRPMNNDQIAECAFALISTSDEDRLSLQDIIVFFDGAKQGKYGRVLDHIDQHVIFEMLEMYREERHRQFKNIEYEKSIHFKGMGDTNRTSDELEDVDIRKEVINYYKQNLKHTQ